MDSEEINRRIAAGLSQKSAAAAATVGGDRPTAQHNNAPAAHTANNIGAYPAYTSLPHQMGTQPATSAGFPLDHNIGPHPPTGGMYPGPAYPMNGGTQQQQQQAPPGFHGFPGYGLNTGGYGYAHPYGIYSQVSVPNSYRASRYIKIRDLNCKARGCSMVIFTYYAVVHLEYCLLILQLLHTETNI